MTNPAPSDVDTEATLLGTMLASHEARRVAFAALVAADFYRPAHGLVFEAIREVHDVGGQVDARVVIDVLTRRGELDHIGGVRGFTDVALAQGYVSNTARYARIVAEMRTLRRLLALGAEMVETARSVPEDVGEAVSEFQARLADLSRITEAPPMWWTVSDFVDAYHENARQWVIEPFLEIGERMVVIAREGLGKSFLTRQMAMAASCGVNPFTLTEMKPVPTLLVDLENPEGVLHRSLSRMEAMARRQSGYDGERAALWHVPTGIDIRTNVGYAHLDAVLDAARPALVCIGPLYKLFRKERRETDEDAALDVTQRLDDLRSRYGFTLVLEHHAPKEQGGKSDLVPFGSSVWMRWPEFGPTLSLPDGKKGNRSRLEWGEWRGPREQRPWPREIVHGAEGTWPWIALWDDGKRPDTGPRQDGIF